MLLCLSGSSQCVWLQNEKRQLETAMVVESRIQMKQKGLSKRSLGETDSYVASEVRNDQAMKQRMCLACCPNLVLLSPTIRWTDVGPPMTAFDRLAQAHRT